MVLRGYTRLGKKSIGDDLSDMRRLFSLQDGRSATIVKHIDGESFASCVFCVNTVSVSLSMRHSQNRKDIT